MKKISWQFGLGIILVSISILIYLVHFLIFRDIHHIFIYLVGDLAFLPLEVLLVTLIIHQLLTKREKRQLLKKMNMVIGVFFNEAGTELFRMLYDFDASGQDIKRNFLVRNDWDRKKFVGFKNAIRSYEPVMSSKKGDLDELKTFLTSKRSFFMGLLENSNLLEHDTFTELLWAVFHLEDELANRHNLNGLYENDLSHLSGDIKRVYILLMAEWIDYMKHLKESYPYLFSLAIRTNPFDEEARVEIK